MKHMVPVIAVATVLTLASWVPLSAEEEKEEGLSASAVPAEVQKAAEAEAKGGTIVRWEKEGSNFEVVVEKGAKQTGVEITPDGKVVSRHNESKEHKEKGEKDE
jgi:plastocyanin